MDFPCSECQYAETCFPLLKLLQKVKNICQQGRRKKKPQSTLAEFPKKDE